MGPHLHVHTSSPGTTPTAPPTPSRPWASFWNSLRKRGPPWSSSSGGSTRTMHQFTQPPVWRIGWRQRGSSCWSICPICQIWHRPTFSCSRESRRPWRASRWTRRNSRMPGQWLPETSLPMTMPWPSGGDLRGLKSESRSAVTLSRNRDRSPSYHNIFINPVRFVGRDTL